MLSRQAAHLAGLRRADTAEVLAVVTLATPHQRSPAHVQPALARCYRRLRSPTAPPVPVLSISGGAADVQVPLLAPAIL